VTLAPGSRLGPYEVLAQIGAGGMGEVWRARDTRLGRDVAIKVLPASFSADADRLRRFEQEARAAGILNHPNITAVFDVGESEDGSPYVVQELLEGETLRHELAGGKFSPRRAIEHAIQIAHGLAAAHEKGIVHRDLKPENVFVTADGRVKILDFGLARMTHAEEASPQATNLPTATPGTEPGMVLGTLGYMSPEQVRGRPADARSDIFSFGAILYEMLAGKQAFKGDSAADTMSAILREDPPDLSVTNENVPPGLERIVRHCLEKSPERRFQSARDLAFDLEALSSDSAPRRPADVPRREGRSGRIPAALAIAAVALLLMVPAAFWLGRRSGAPPIPAFRQLTFRRGSIRGARFTSDGQTVVYAAAWEGKPLAIYSMRTDSQDASPVDLPGGADLLAVSRSGEAALQLGRRSIEPYVSSGTLSVAPIGGGQAPRERLQGVQWADWSPDGSRLAIVRDAGGRNRLESPVGTVLYETAGWIGSPRFSPQGDTIALIDHWGRLGDLGLIVVVDLPGHARTISEGWSSIQGLAWAPGGKEVWFTGTKSAGNRALYAASRSGELRLVYRQTGSLTLADVSSKGEVLLVDEDLRLGIVSRAPGEPAERDSSYLDFSAVRALSSDGKLVLFDEASEGGGEEGSIFLRKTDGSPPVRLGAGFSMAFSPDGKSVLAGTPRDLLELPTAAGRVRGGPSDRAREVRGRLGRLASRRPAARLRGRARPGSATLGARHERRRGETDHRRRRSPDPLHEPRLSGREVRSRRRGRRSRFSLPHDGRSTDADSRARPRRGAVQLGYDGKIPVRLSAGRVPGACIPPRDRDRSAGSLEGADAGRPGGHHVHSAAALQRRWRSVRVQLRPRPPRALPREGATVRRSEISAT